MVRASGPVLVTTTPKVNWPPGSGRLLGLADFSTRMTGSRLVRVTTASSVSLTELPSSSAPVTVTMSVWLAPALPVKLPGNEQV